MGNVFLKPDREVSQQYRGGGYWAPGAVRRAGGERGVAPASPDSPPCQSRPGCPRVRRCPVSLLQPSAGGAQRCSVSFASVLVPGPGGGCYANRHSCLWAWVTEMFRPKGRGALVNDKEIVRKSPNPCLPCPLVFRLSWVSTFMLGEEPMKEMLSKEGCKHETAGAAARWN